MSFVYTIAEVLREELIRKLGSECVEEVRSVFGGLAGHQFIVDTAVNRGAVQIWVDRVTVYDRHWIEIGRFYFTEPTLMEDILGALDYA